MCEILVRIEDKTHENPDINVTLSKKGDVIVVVEDEHLWGELEKSQPFWQIIKLPNISVDQINSSLMMRQHPIGHDKVPLCNREFYLDFDNVLDAPRLYTFIILNWTFDVLLSYRKRRR